MKASIQVRLLPIAYSPPLPVKKIPKNCAVHPFIQQAKKGHNVQVRSTIYKYNSIKISCTCNGYKINANILPPGSPYKTLAIDKAGKTHNYFLINSKQAYTQFIDHLRFIITHLVAEHMDVVHVELVDSKAIHKLKTL